MPNKYTEEDAAKDTDSSKQEVQEAWHDAREKAQEAGELPEREESKEKEKEEEKK